MIYGLNAKGVIKMKSKDLVTIVCYNKVETREREEALKFYRNGFNCSDGAEKERYANIIMDLMGFGNLAYDRVSKIPNGFHECKYCGGLAEGDFEDLLCGECRYDFGHSLFSEL